VGHGRQEAYRSLAPSSARDANVAIVVCSAADHSSIKNVRTWVDQSSLPETAVVFVVVNRLDLIADSSERVRIVDGLDGVVPYIAVCSAKTGESVEALFQNVAKFATQDTEVQNLLVDTAPEKRNDC
jgi:GTPase SAR1 family protein